MDHCAGVVEVAAAVGLGDTVPVDVDVDVDVELETRHTAAALPPRRAGLPPTRGYPKRVQHGQHAATARAYC